MVKDKQETTTISEKPKSTRVLIDPTKGQARLAPIPANIYVDFQVDSDTGLGKYHIWWNQRDNEQKGKVEEIETSEITGLKKLVATEYTEEYSEEKLRDLIKRGGKSARVYLKEGEATYDYTNSVEKLIAYMKDRMS